MQLEMIRSPSRQPKLEDVLELLGLAEAAELLGLSKPALVQRCAAADFPQPIARLAATPVWTRQQIERYAIERDARYVERPAVRALAREALRR